MLRTHHDTALSPSTRPRPDCDVRRGGRGGIRDPRATLETKADAGLHSGVFTSNRSYSQTSRVLAEAMALIGANDDEQKIKAIFNGLQHKKIEGKK